MRTISSAWIRLAHSSSSSQWKQRQSGDVYAREAKAQGLKSRAAFKLLELDKKHHLFRASQTVVDLGYAPGSWSQVAIGKTGPRGCVVGVDLLPASPPVGMALAVQGDFLMPLTQSRLVEQVRMIKQKRATEAIARKEEERSQEIDPSSDPASHILHENIEELKPESYTTEEYGKEEIPSGGRIGSGKYFVDVVLSDMMMNTTGNQFKDHIGSMQLCIAALRFASDTLKAGGDFVCKFYMGSDDKKVEDQLKQIFRKVYRVKPDSSRKESREAYWVAQSRKERAALDRDFTV